MWNSALLEMSTDTIAWYSYDYYIYQFSWDTSLDKKTKINFQFYLRAFSCVYLKISIIQLMYIILLWNSWFENMN